MAAFSAGTVAALSFATSVGAVTVAELQAQINMLLAQLQSLQGTTAVSTTFTTDLTVGSTGPQVVALQSFLEAKGYLVMPVGVAKGYFGGLTRAAVARYQAANAISPAVGYFGPITRSAVNAAAGSVVVPGGTSTGGTVGGSTGSNSGVITTPGVEGTLTASLNSTPSSVKLYEGDSKRGVLGIKLEANTSDIRVERIKLDLGTNTAIYRKIADKVYVMDGSNVLASANLNSDTVVKEDSNYFITLSGFGYVVPKDSTRVLTIALDAADSFDSDYDGDSWTLTVPMNGVRGIDGAGIDQYSPTSANGFNRAFTSEGDLAADSTLKLSLSSNSPAPAQVIASEGADNNEIDGVTLLKFEAKAEKDDVTITDVTATTTLTGAAELNTIYLMDGNTVLGSESGPTTAGTSAVTFDNIDFTISKDSTRTLSIVVDIRNASTTESTATTSVVFGGVVAENSNGDVTIVSGSATSDTLTILNVGPQITLNSKSISKSSTDTGTTTAQATFNVTLKAVGGDISFNSTGTTTPGAGLFDFAVYKTSGTTTVSAVSFSVPSSGVVTYTGGFTVQEGNSVTFPVDVIYTVGPNTAISTYSIGLDAVNWGTSSADDTANATDFMTGRTEWRTSSIVLP